MGQARSATLIAPTIIPTIAATAPPMSAALCSGLVVAGTAEPPFGGFHGGGGGFHGGGGGFHGGGHGGGRR